MQATKQAIDAGADMVKIQCIDPYSACDWASKKQIHRYMALYKLFGHVAWRDYFLEANHRFKQPIFASCFDSATVHWLRDAVPCYKIAHRCSNWAGLKESIESTHHPFMVSLSDEIPTIWLEKPSKAIYLYCLAYKYPLSDKDWCYVFAQKPKSKLIDGLSLHTNDVGKIASICKWHSPKVIEVHVQGSGASGPDIAFALRMRELERLRTLLK